MYCLYYNTRSEKNQFTEHRQDNEHKKGAKNGKSGPDCGGLRGFRRTTRTPLELSRTREQNGTLGVRSVLKWWRSNTYSTELDPFFDFFSVVNVRDSTGIPDRWKWATSVLRSTVVPSDVLQRQSQSGALTNTMENISEMNSRPWEATTAPQSTAEGWPWWQQSHHHLKQSLW